MTPESSADGRGIHVRQRIRGAGTGNAPPVPPKSMHGVFPTGGQFLRYGGQSTRWRCRTLRPSFGRMIHQVTGDILLSGAQAIAHGTSPNDHFDSGLALSLRQDWPALYKDFRHYLHTSHPKAGGLWVWSGADGRRVISLFTQEPAPSEHAHPGKATLHNVNQCLRELHKLVETEKFASLAISRLATGVGGLDWSQVEPLIRQHLGALGIPVYVYATYQKGVKAPEGQK